MVGGQAIDLQAAGQAPGHQIDLDADGLRRMHGKKTGAMIRASATAGAMLGGGTPPLVSAIDQAAGEFGLAFQIVDDILDVEGDSSALGKTAGKDAAADKPTYPALFGLDRKNAWWPTVPRPRARGARLDEPRRQPSDGHRPVDYRKKKLTKVRLDQLIFERGLAPSRERAQALVLAALVKVDGQVVSKAGAPVAADARVELVAPDHPVRVAAASSWRMRSTRSPSIPRHAARSTSARPPAASPMSCCSAAQCTSSRSTSVTASSTGRSATTRASSSAKASKCAGAHD